VEVSTQIGDGKFAEQSSLFSAIQNVSLAR